MKVNFYLRKPDKRSVSKKSLIILQIKYKTIRYWWSTNLSIRANDWDKKKHRVKDVIATQKSGEISINKSLDGFVKAFNEAFNQDAGMIPTPEVMRQRMDAYQNQKIATIAGATHLPSGPTFYSMLQEIIDRFKRKGTRADIRNAENTEATQKHLVALFPNLNFEDVTEDFWIEFVNGLREGKHSDGKNKCSGRTIQNDLRIIKRIMEKANEKGLTENDQYEGFEVDTEPKDAVALIPSEIEKILKLDLDLSNSTEKRLSEVRDLFIVACHTGFRWSDFHDIQKDRILKTPTGFVFKIYTEKTGAAIDMPAHPDIEEIFKRYPDSPNFLPQGIVGRRFNKDIKTVCKKAKLNEIGLLHTDPIKPLWECVSSHTGRRSFCTNLYVNKDKTGMSLAHIMFLTGHKTESAFQGYIKPRTGDAANAYRQTFPGAIKQ